MPSSFKCFRAEPLLISPRLTIRACALHEQMPPSVIHRPAGTGDYLFMQFYQPVRAGWSEAESEWVLPGTVLIWKPGECQYYGHAEQGYDHTWLHCSGGQVAELLGGDLDRPRPLVVGSGVALETLMRGLYREFSEGDRADPVIAGNLLENALREIRRRVTGPEGVRPPERLLRVKALIDLRFAEPLTLADLAEMANWSPGYFSEMFRKHYGSSPVDYLIRQRISRAAYLLKDISRSVAEVGQAVGYDDPYYFSRLFRRMTGISPRQAREDVRGAHGRFR